VVNHHPLEVILKLSIPAKESKKSQKPPLFATILLNGFSRGEKLARAE
jgi:hypothetical protein